MHLLALVISSNENACQSEFQREMSKLRVRQGKCEEKATYGYTVHGIY